MTGTGQGDETARVDGRTERRRRGQQAVVDATMALIVELGRAPSADEVAARAGVSAATLFRYFPTLDELRTEAIGRFAASTGHLADLPGIGVGDRDERIASLITARLALYETVAPIARFARARSSEQPLLADVVNARRDAMASQVREHFAAEVDALDDVARTDLVDTIVALTSFEAWDLAIGAGRDHDDVTRAWTSALRKLLA